jgi:hypothetical protein
LGRASLFFYARHSPVFFFLDKAKLLLAKKKKAGQLCLPFSFSKSFTFKKEKRSKLRFYQKIKSEAFKKERNIL